MTTVKLHMAEGGTQEYEGMHVEMDPREREVVIFDDDFVVIATIDFADIRRIEVDLT